MRSRAMLAPAVATLVALGLAATSSASAAGVSIVGRAYQPPTTTVNLGETVTWTNRALESHTVTAVGGAFDSGTLNPQGSFSFRFSTPGSYLYACTIHPTMKGTVLVRSGQLQSPQGPGGGPLGAGKRPQAVQLHLSKHSGAHGSQTLVHVQAPRPGAKALLELFKGSAWRRVSETRLSSKGRATLSVSSSVDRRLRVVVLGQPGERSLISRVVHPTT